jgi:hypothetical protein
VVGYASVQPKYGGDVDDLEVGAEAVDRCHGPDGVRGGGRSGADGERAPVFKKPAETSKIGFRAPVFLSIPPVFEKIGQIR